MPKSHSPKQQSAKAANKLKQDDACINTAEREQARRSANMAAIHGKDTKPEMVVRKWLWGHGFRYRLNHPRLPGKPDIVMRKYRTCIFVNGCFWHGHFVELDKMERSQCCRIPNTNRDFWAAKIRRNKERDKEEQRKLAEMGWHCITVWECELTPKRCEETLESIVFTLNHIWLQDHSVKGDFYPKEEESNPISIAAEE